MKKRNFKTVALSPATHRFIRRTGSDDCILPDLPEQTHFHQPTPGDSNNGDCDDTASLDGRSSTLLEATAASCGFACGAVGRHVGVGRC